MKTGSEEERIARWVTYVVTLCVSMPLNSLCHLFGLSFLSLSLSLSLFLWLRLPQQCCTGPIALCGTPTLFERAVYLSWQELNRNVIETFNNQNDHDCIAQRLEYHAILCFCFFFVYIFLFAFPRQRIVVSRIVVPNFLLN